MRLERSLGGTWQFGLDPEGRMTVEALTLDREIPVPLPWQAAFPDLQQYSGYAWYRRVEELTPEWLAGEVLLHFGAVDYWCQVFVNENLAGEHEGGYTPFSLPIRRFLQPGPNAIAVRVYDSVQSGITIPRWPDYRPDAGASGPPFDAEHIPHGKQEWYINVGGLWQDVKLVAVPTAYIDRVHITPDIRSGEARVEVELGGDVTGLNGGQLAVAVDADGVDDVTLPLAPGQSVYQARLTVSQPQLWDITAPHLYTAQVRLETGEATDETTTRFGFREISTANGQILLNGRSIVLLAALDQDLYPDTIYTVLSDDYLRDQFQKALDLGLNCLRCHIKPPDPRYLDLADEMGLLVWAEIPSWRTFYTRGTTHAHQLDLHAAIHRRVEQTLAEMIRRDFNHPSLVIWTLVNEDWGTALPLSAADRAWVADLYDQCKRLDPTRLVVDNSACLHAWGPNIHVKSDLDDFHIYANIPDQARWFEQVMDQFAARPLWTYSSQGDAQRTGQEPLVLSEFGNWGLPSLHALRQAAGGADPHWFGIGAWWNPYDGEPGWPRGVAERFTRYGLDKVWADYEAFVTATQWHQFGAMKYEIEAMRRQPGLAGYVITEFTDAYWESNGLLDFYRGPKVYHDRFNQINALDVVIPQTDRYAAWDDTDLAVRLHLSHYSDDDWEGARLRVRVAGIEEGTAVPLPTLAQGEVRRLPTRRWTLPQVDATQTLPIEFVVEDAEGGALARNQLDVLVLPASSRPPGYTGPIAVLGSLSVDVDEPAPPALSPQTPDTPGLRPDETPLVDDLEAATLPLPLRGLLQALGYQARRRPSADTRLAVTSYPTPDLLQWVRQGGDLLYLTSGPSPFFWAQGRGGPYSGSWMTSFSWLRPNAHSRLQDAPNPLSLPFMAVMPQSTILGLPFEDRAVQGDFLAGMIIGWVRHPAVHTVQFRYGQGRVVMTTFAIEEGLRQADPVAIALLHDLVDHLASDRCQPTLQANY
ncbi:MAG: hypothetical protein KIT87_11400 [Anaerolineae bacterium]|nr:hypothetical protein [Anaerolineae bacterium]